mmetsp:Transcript_13928/g.39626  ORF Transcript_13928/g.39626 Transcript_13928/m.39626 type:complete len:219 (+) Transcript_13928:123-779(+)
MNGMAAIAEVVVASHTLIVAVAWQRIARIDIAAGNKVGAVDAFGLRAGSDAHLLNAIDRSNAVVGAVLVGRIPAIQRLLACRHFQASSRSAVPARTVAVRGARIWQIGALLHTVPCRIEMIGDTAAAEGVDAVDGVTARLVGALALEAADVLDARRTPVPAVGLADAIRVARFVACARLTRDVVVGRVDAVHIAKAGSVQSADPVRTVLIGGLAIAVT